MQLTAQLAGFSAAHAVWCVSDGETLIPFIAYESDDGSRQIIRIAHELLQEGVAHGKDWLANNPESAMRAVLVYDGFVTLLEGKTDALIIEGMEFSPSRAGFTMAVPYRLASSPEGFAVHRPKFLGFEGGEPSFDSLGAAFFQGVDQHEEGSAVWIANLDDSR
jgi:hypothetical protein